MNAAKLVTGSLLGFDGEAVVINDIVYIINPPTIAKIAGASYFLSGFSEVSTIDDALKSMGNIDDASKALSWFIQGDESLSVELSKGTFDEVLNGLETAYSLISAENFIRLSTLAKNVARLTANPRP